MDFRHYPGAEIGGRCMRVRIAVFLAMAMLAVLGCDDRRREIVAHEKLQVGPAPTTSPSTAPARDPGPPRTDCPAVRSLVITDMRDFGAAGALVGTFGGEQVEALTPGFGSDPAARCARHQDRALARLDRRAARECTAFCARAGTSCVGQTHRTGQSYSCAMSDPTAATTPGGSDDRLSVADPDYLWDDPPDLNSPDPPRYLPRDNSTMVGTVTGNVTCRCSLAGG
jgi:hypothetical protein